MPLSHDRELLKFACVRGFLEEKVKKCLPSYFTGASTYFTDHVIVLSGHTYIQFHNLASILVEPKAAKISA